MSKTELGEGNFCRVFLASVDGQSVAAKFIKVLSDEPAAANDENEPHLREEYMNQYRRELLQYVEEIELTLQVAAHGQHHRDVWLLCSSFCSAAGTSNDKLEKVH